MTTQFGAETSAEEAAPNADIEIAVLDFFDLDSVRRGADDIASRFSRIDRLINNASVIACPLDRHMDENDVKDLMARRKGGSPMVYKQVPQGAATTVWAAAAPELDGRGDLYCEDCGVAETIENPSMDQGIMSWAIDEEAAARLWTLSEEWSGDAFPA